MKILAAALAIGCMFSGAILFDVAVANTWPRATMTTPGTVMEVAMYKLIGRVGEPYEAQVQTPTGEAFITASVLSNCTSVQYLDQVEVTCRDGFLHTECHLSLCNER